MGQSPREAKIHQPFIFFLRFTAPIIIITNYHHHWCFTGCWVKLSSYEDITFL